VPELPEVETVKRKLNKRLQNKKIMKVEVFHNNVFAKQDIEKIKEMIKNQTIHQIKRRGKWLLFELDKYYLLSHLRMEGKYLYKDFKEAQNKHELVIFNIDNEFELRYQDTRKFGKMYLVEKSKEITPLKELGLEPWDKNLTKEYLKEKLKTIDIKKTAKELEIGELTLKDIIDELTKPRKRSKRRNAKANFKK